VPVNVSLVGVRGGVDDGVVDDPELDPLPLEQAIDRSSRRHGR
jgi:hypothetical protein